MSTIPNVATQIQEAVVASVEQLYGASIDPQQVPVNPTRKEFVGDFTVVTFPLTRAAKKKPDQIAEELGAHLVQEIAAIEGFNVIKGFLNLELSTAFWTHYLQQLIQVEKPGYQSATGKKVLIEFSSPNTNKPLHLGHIRNILLGWSCSKILEAAGNEVVRVQIINDRGIAICKSMLMWQMHADGATPESTGVKGDHFVGDYYVRFEREFSTEYSAWQQTDLAKALFAEKAKDEQSESAFWKGYKNKYFNEFSVLGAACKQMLQDWENGVPEVRQLWQQMNGWVYAGFEQTYADLGVSFDKLYYESETYLSGKAMVEEGLAKDVFFRKEDQSVWADLTEAKLDEKVVLRSDGTSVYVTQDLGTARLRYQDFGVDSMVYVVADEQNYHFQVLFELLKRLEEPYAQQLHHLSYGMVELPSGRMKTREGTVVDADDLITEVTDVARTNALERGEIASFSEEERNATVRKVGLGALKYFIIRVQPKKWMTFSPEESVDMQGQTGPYIQYAVVRIKGLERRAAQEGIDLALAANYSTLEEAEKTLLQQLYQFDGAVQEAAANYDPSIIAQYAYTLAKGYSKFWHDVAVFNAPQPEAIAFRIELSIAVKKVLETALDLLGIAVPDKM